MTTEQFSDAKIKEKIGNHFVKSIEQIDHNLLLHLVPANILHDLSFFNFQNAITACFFTDRNLVMRNFNKNFQAFFKEEEPLIGQELKELFEKLGLEESIIEDFSDQITRQGWAKIPQLIITMNKESRYFSLFSTHTDFEGLQSLSGIQGQFIDVTQQVLLKKQQDKLASQIRHDMKNRISATLMGSEMVLQDYQSLQSDDKLPPELDGFFAMLKDTLKDIHESSDYLSRLVLQMLDISKLQDCQLKLDYSRFRIDDALAQVIKALRSLQDSRNIEVEVSGDTAEIEADFVQVSRVLENYHSNALKYAAKKVRWSMVCEEDHLNLIVTDDGEGIPVEYIEKIFLPFFQIPGKEKKGSTGLGLDSVKELVNLHQGSTWAESDGPGKGSRFYVELPLTRKQGG